MTNVTHDSFLFYGESHMILDSKRVVVQYTPLKKIIDLDAYQIINGEDLKLPLK